MEAKETHLVIAGMTCGSCVAHVRKELLAVEGVRGAQVERSGSAVIDHEVSVPSSRLVAAVVAAGYAAADTHR